MTTSREITTNEEYKARYILEYGVEKTAQALTTMLGHEVSPVRVNLEKYETWLAQGLGHKRDIKDHVVMLKTELVGGVTGINYFLLTKEEMKLIGSECLTDEMTDGNRAILIEFLKEIENVLAAATISEMADKLRVDLYGDVPKIQAVYATEVEQVISREAALLNPILVLHCQMHIPKLGMSPDFLWLFNSSLFEVLEQIEEFEILENAPVEK
ncbi:MAG: hypothetical protein ABJF11_04670 [Reichenbachiella sp.]|uniref:hypothetical protein n=1 Tax=Reichenbachiella sp. TaxID=2184521 RepID=UPI0032669E2A